MSLMTPEQVLDELGAKDMRFARRVMREAGAFDIGNGRLRLHPDDLRAWLEVRRTTPGSSAAVTVVETRRRARRAVTVGALGDKWWEQGGEG
jgi:hypothetical protein